MMKGQKQAVVDHDLNRCTALCGPLYHDVEIEMRWREPPALKDRRSD
jgi:hypothetical protein